MREIRSDETYKLKECLTALAAHHNKVSVNFKGCYPKTPVEETMERFSLDLNTGKAYIAVIEKDEKVAGFCKVNPDHNIGVLEYLVVLEEYRGMGYGAELVEWALDKLSGFGVRDIDVKVADGNDAVTLYEKYGFKMNAHILRLSR
ncbi:MAG: GNAT family N-acetyltransferase [Lachnospiraceae bacterium]|nr:GNAT family N-acetyltransferase [Lachnospiraceae bacterium]